MNDANAHNAPLLRLSIIVPCFNEEENLPPLIEAVFKALSSDPRFVELILVDDGSSDHTSEIVRGMSAYEPRLRLVAHARNRGLGTAIRTGLEAATGDYVLYTDADLPFDFGQIPRLLTQAHDDQVVIGYRSNRGEGVRRWLLSKGYNLLCRAVFGLRVRDVNFACKLFPRRAVEGMRLGSEGSFIDAEMLLECRNLGLETTEFPLVYRPRMRGCSTLSRTSVIARILAEMVNYKLHRARPKYEVIEKTDHQCG
ncbi:MAG: glycosyltransferase family 2 protein [Blastocatellales bacterium]